MESSNRVSRVRMNFSGCSVKEFKSVWVPSTRLVKRRKNVVDRRSCRLRLPVDSECEFWCSWSCWRDDWRCVKISIGCCWSNVVRRLDESVEVSMVLSTNRGRMMFRLTAREMSIFNFEVINCNWARSISLERATMRWINHRGECFERSTFEDRSWMGNFSKSKRKFCR